MVKSAEATKTYLDRPPPGWFVLDVLREDTRRRTWVALMIDVPPDDLKNCKCKTAWLYVHPKDYRPLPGRIAQEAVVLIPGKHRTHDDAWKAMEEAFATRH